MPSHRYTQSRRTHRQVQADGRADALAAFLGRSLRNTRLGARTKQVEASAIAGISQSCWSELERGHGAKVSLRVWVRAGDAVGTDLRGYLERASGAQEPRDAVHLRHQELIARIAKGGGWRPEPEHDLGGAGVADLLLARAEERVLIEVWDWFADVGDAFRSWDRKLERLSARQGTRVSGCWAIRAMRSNRELVTAHRTIFAARFAGIGRSWLAALTDAGSVTPEQAGLLWVSVAGGRLFPSRWHALRR